MLGRIFLSVIPTLTARRMAVQCPSSPVDLCRDLRLKPTEEQVRLMLRLSQAAGVVDARLASDKDGLPVSITAGDVLRAALMVVLWRTLRLEGSRATILAPTKKGSIVATGELGELAMAYLAEVCMVQDAGLKSISSIPTWSRIEFASVAGWEVRLVPNVPAIVTEAGPRSRTGLVIGAGHGQTALDGAQEALEHSMDLENSLLIRLW